MVTFIGQKIELAAAKIKKAVKNQLMVLKMLKMKQS